MGDPGLEQGTLTLSLFTAQNGGVEIPAPSLPPHRPPPSNMTCVYADRAYKLAKAQLGDAALLYESRHRQVVRPAATSRTYKRRMVRAGKGNVRPWTLLYLSRHIWLKN